MKILFCVTLFAMSKYKIKLLISGSNLSWNFFTAIIRSLCVVWIYISGQDREYSLLWSQFIFIQLPHCDQRCFFKSKLIFPWSETRRNVSICRKVQRKRPHSQSDRGCCNIWCQQNHYHRTWKFKCQMVGYLILKNCKEIFYVQKTIKWNSYLCSLKDLNFLSNESICTE